MDGGSSYFCSHIRTIPSILKNETKTELLAMIRLFQGFLIDSLSHIRVMPHLVPLILPTGVLGFRVLVPLQNYSWYCLSVAVKKSSRTLLR